jgi:hypothetical protein
MKFNWEIKLYYIFNLGRYFCSVNLFNDAGFGVLTAVVTNVAIFWYIAQCSSYVNRRFGGTSLRIRTARVYILEDGDIYLITSLGFSNVCDCAEPKDECE